MKKLIYDTPIKTIKIDQGEILIKREDLACRSPGPPFAKVRGLLPVLKKLREKGINTVGYMDTTVSWAGWGISYFCQQFDPPMRAVIYYPEYLVYGPRDNQHIQFKKWKQFKAEIRSLEKPNRLSINFYRAKKMLLNEYPDAFMLPQGLPFEETKDEVCKQTIRHSEMPFVKTIVACAGSGTMLAGILKGLNFISQVYYPPPEITVYGVLVSPKSGLNQRKKIIKMSGLNEKGLLNRLTTKLKIIDAGYNYTDKEECKCPFPCNVYYDRKAWKWLLDNFKDLKPPILFWNIGA